MESSRFFRPQLRGLVQILSSFQVLDSRLLFFSQNYVRTCNWFAFLWASCALAAASAVNLRINPTYGKRLVLVRFIPSLVYPQICGSPGRCRKDRLDSIVQALLQLSRLPKVQTSCYLQVHWLLSVTMKSSEKFTIGTLPTTFSLSSSSCLI